MEGEAWVSPLLPNFGRQMSTKTAQARKGQLATARRLSWGGVAVGRSTHGEPGQTHRGHVIRERPLGARMTVGSLRNKACPGEVGPAADSVEVQCRAILGDRQRQCGMGCCGTDRSPFAKQDASRHELNSA
jgi:hypothetical protein